jgi:hypothetical protein
MYVCMRRKEVRGYGVSVGAVAEGARAAGGGGGGHPFAAHGRHAQHQRRVRAQVHLHAAYRDRGALRRGTVYAEGALVFRLSRRRRPNQLFSDYLNDDSI